MCAWLNSVYGADASANLNKQTNKLSNQQFVPASRVIWKAIEIPSSDDATSVSGVEVCLIRQELITIREMGFVTVFLIFMVNLLELIQALKFR